jgi:hypothetical protein
VKVFWTRWHTLGGIVTSITLGGCATMMFPSSEPAPSKVHPAAPTEANGAAAARPAAPAPSPVRPESSLRAFADVIRGASESAGFFPLWRKDEKVWIEVPVARLDQPFLLSINVHSSVGERGLYASQMDNSWVASFRRVGNQMQLIARNLAYRAEGNAPLQQALSQAFSDSRSAPRR